jgi:hypothetical protein
MVASIRLVQETEFRTTCRVSSPSPSQLNMSVILRYSATARFNIKSVIHGHIKCPGCTLLVSYYVNGDFSYLLHTTNRVLVCVHSRLSFRVLVLVNNHSNKSNRNNHSRSYFSGGSYTNYPGHALSDITGSHNHVYFRVQAFCGMAQYLSTNSTNKWLTKPHVHLIGYTYVRRLTPPDMY